MFVAVAVVAVAVNGVKPPEWARDLDLQVKVIEAIEDGPVVLEAEVVNRGPRLKHHWYVGDRCRLELPPEWGAEKLSGPLFHFGVADGIGEIGGYSPMIERHALNAKYASRFPAGTYSITVAWPLYVYVRAIPGEEDTTQVTLTRTISVTVLPATRQNLSDLAKRLDAEYRDCLALPTSSFHYHERHRQLEDKFVRTRHKEFVPVAIRMLNRSEQWRQGAIMDMIFNADHAGAHDLFVKQLTSSEPRDDIVLPFRVWGSATSELRRYLSAYWWEYLTREVRAGRRPIMPFLFSSLFGFLNSIDTCRSLTLSDAHVRRLADAPDFRVRAMTFATFRDRLGAEWGESFLDGIRGTKKMQDRIRKLIGELDEPRFAVRDRAEAALVAEGPRAAVPLRTALAAGLGAEAAPRARRVLARVDSDRLEPRGRRVIEALNPGTAVDRKLLEVLADGGAGVPAAELARRCLKEYDLKVAPAVPNKAKRE